MPVPDLSKLGKMPPGVAEALAQPQLKLPPVPIVKMTTLIGAFDTGDERVGDELLRVLRCYHGLPQGSEVTQFRLHMAGAIEIARELLAGTGHVVTYDPDSEVRAVVEAMQPADDEPTADEGPPDGS